MDRKILQTYLLCLFLVSMQSTGYDIYAHSLIYYFNFEKITHSYTFFESELVFPRYILLSIVYEATRNISIPLGWVACFLVFWPTYNILKTFGTWRLMFEQPRYTLLFFICVNLIYFYSALSLTILWLSAFLITKRVHFIAGSFFHPIGVALGLFTLIVSDKKWKGFLYYIFTLSVIVIIMHVNSVYYNTMESIDADNIKIAVDINNISEIISYAYSQKLIEVNLLCLIILSIAYRKFFIKKRRRVYFKISKKINTVCSIFLFSLFYSTITINAFTRDINSLFLSTLTLKMSDIIYITWFDFGFRDGNLHVWSVDDSRFEMR